MKDRVRFKFSDNSGAQYNGDRDHDAMVDARNLLLPGLVCLRHDKDGKFTYEIDLKIDFPHREIVAMAIKKQDIGRMDECPIVHRVIAESDIPGNARKQMVIFKEMLAELDSMVEGS
jgi:hypothetical protein